MIVITSGGVEGEKQLWVPGTRFGGKGVIRSGHFKEIRACKGKLPPPLFKKFTAYFNVLGTR